MDAHEMVARDAEHVLSRATAFPYMVHRSERDALEIARDGEALAEVVIFPPGGFQARLTADMHAHSAATYETLAKQFRTRAREAWANDDHERAKVLKDLAKEMELVGNERRRQQAAAENRGGVHV